MDYILLWKGQKLMVTVTHNSVEIVNQTGTAPITLEVWDKEYNFTKELLAIKK